MLWSWLGVAAAADVLVLYADDPGGSVDVADYLVGTGLITSAQPWDVTVSNPTLAELLAYDAVLTYSNESYLDGPGLSAVLRAYVDLGHGVVMAHFSTASVGAQLTGFEAYAPFVYDRDIFSSPGESMVWLDRDSPLLVDVGVVTDLGINHGTTHLPRPGVEVVAEWPSGAAAVGLHTPSGAGPVVGINLFPPSSRLFSGWWDFSTDGATLLANALLLAAGTPRDVPLRAAAAGSCPGAVTLSIANGPAFGTVTLVSGRAGGSFTVPRGACAGTTVPLGAPALRGVIALDAAGAGQRVVSVGPGACGGAWLAFDTASCEASAVVSLP